MKDKKTKIKISDLPVIGFDPDKPVCLECKAEIGVQTFLMGRMKHQVTGKEAFAPICINCAVGIISPILAPAIAERMLTNVAGHPPFPHDHDGDGNPIIPSAVDPTIKH